MTKTTFDDPEDNGDNVLRHAYSVNTTANSGWYYPYYPTVPVVYPTIGPYTYPSTTTVATTRLSPALEVLLSRTDIVSVDFDADGNVCRITFRNDDDDPEELI